MNQYQSGKRNKLKMFTLEIKIILKQVFETLYFIVTTDSCRTGLTKKKLLSLRTAMIKVIFFVGFLLFILFLI